MVMAVIRSRPLSSFALRLAFAVAVTRSLVMALAAGSPLM